MIVLTGRGALASAFQQVKDVAIASHRELAESIFFERLSRATVVVHNASSINCTNIEEAISRNFDFTRKIVQFLEQKNPNAHLIYISSMSILDHLSSAKYASVEKMNAYSYSKYLAETYVLKSKLNAVSSVRFSTIFYRDPTRDGLSKLITDAATHNEISLINRGAARRDFLPISIAARYLDRLCDIAPTSKQCYTIASGIETSFKQIATMLESLSPGLRVSNASLPESTNILSTFTKDDIEKLGEIRFSLEYEVENYFNAVRGVT